MMVGRAGALRLAYRKGLLLSDAYAPGLRYEERLRAYVGLPYRYADVLAYFRESGISVEDEVISPLPLQLGRGEELKLRDYQRRALEAWRRAGRRGVVVIPTGAGKTIIALEAIREVAGATIVLVPTIDLLWQWSRAIAKHLGVTPGVLGGGEDEVRGITVSTYDSAYSRAEELGNRFVLAVFDEVHHLPSPGYMEVAQVLAAPYRLGLTATPEREDGRHSLLPDLVGPIVIRVSPAELRGKYLADYDVKRVYVSLTDDERARYEELRRRLRGDLGRLGLRLRSLDDFHRLLSLAARDPVAKDAVEAWYESVRLAVNSRAKLEALRELLREYSDRKVLVFTRDTEMAYAISREFLVPAVTYKTPKEERAKVLEMFRRGDYRVIVASSVFDEGVDVPDAGVAVIVGGYGTPRQFVQRLGRVLRPAEGKRALLIELVTRGTVDGRISRRRREGAEV
jgi:superfamily II DNA or RNA helicase|nr:DEAD/DEAH box helicase family protein [Acidilobus sp. 7A]